MWTEQEPEQVLQQQAQPAATSVCSKALFERQRVQVMAEVSAKDREIEATGEMTDPGSSSSSNKKDEEEKEGEGDKGKVEKQQQQQQEEEIETKKKKKEGEGAEEATATTDGAETTEHRAGTGKLSLREPPGQAQHDDSDDTSEKAEKPEQQHGNTDGGGSLSSDGTTTTTLKKGAGAVDAPIGTVTDTPSVMEKKSTEAKDPDDANESVSLSRSGAAQQEKSHQPEQPQKENDNDDATMNHPDKVPPAANQPRKRPREEADKDSSGRADTNKVSRPRIDNASMKNTKNKMEQGLIAPERKGIDDRDETRQQQRQERPDQNPVRFVSKAGEIPLLHQ